MHAAVLANLEFGEVEAKGARLPDQVLQLTERQPMRARQSQRLLHEHELLNQFIGTPVAAGLAEAPRLETGCCVEHKEPVRFVGRPQREPADQIRVVAPSIVDRCSELGARWCRCRLRGAQVSGAPEDVDLLEEPSARVRLLAGATAWVIDPIELLACPRDRGDDGTTAGLCRCLLYTSPSPRDRQK